MFKFLKYLRGFMGQINRTHTTLIQEKVASGGEITINLNLTIKLDSDGLSLSVGDVVEKKKVSLVEDKEDLLIPDIESGKLIEFGRKVE